MLTQLHGVPYKKMSSSQKTAKKDAKSGKNDNMKTGSKQLTLAEGTPMKINGDASGESEMLTELRKLRQENNESFRDLKLSLNRLEASVGDIKQQMEGLEKRITEAEKRVSDTEDRGIRQEKALGYLLR